MRDCGATLICENVLEYDRMDVNVAAGSVVVT
jgi:hypothetical protein